MKYRYNPPCIIKNIFSTFQWESKVDKILLTFDDGPIPEATPLILDTLAFFKIKAAFFCVGENVSKYPELYRNIINEGHLVCNHTYNHKSISKLNPNELREQIEKFNNILKTQSGDVVLYFRPPYGKFNFSSYSFLKNMDMKTVMWSLLTYDYKNDFNVVKFAIHKYLRKNSIIVLHDSLKSKNIIEESINYIINECLHKGYTIGAPDECLR